MKNKDSIFFVLCLAYVTSFFFLSVFPSGNVITLALLAVFSLFVGSAREKTSLLKQRPHVMLMVAFGAWLLISALTSANQHSAMRTLTLRLPLIILPFTLGLVSISKELRNRILLGSAVIVTLACAASLINAIIHFHATHDSAWLYNDSLSLLIGQQSIYTSLLVNISIFIFAHAIFYTDNRYKGWLGLAVIFLFIISYLLASRNMMALLYISLIGFAFFYLFRRKKYLEGATLIMGLGIGAFLIFKFFPDTVNRFRELLYTHYDYKSQAAESHYAGTLTAEQWNGANFRLAAWPCGWQVFKEHPVTGVGLGDKREELMKVFQQRGFKFAIDTNRNVHNNYLDILLSTGLVGFLLFMSGWLVLPFIRVVRNRDGLACMIIVTFAVAMITEDYFDRSIGGMLFGFFVLLMMTAKRIDIPG